MGRRVRPVAGVYRPGLRLFQQSLSGPFARLVPAVQTAARLAGGRSRKIDRATVVVLSCQYEVTIKSLRTRGLRVYCFSATEAQRHGGQEERSGDRRDSPNRFTSLKLGLAL